MKKNIYHKPVLINSSTENLVFDPEGTYVDATFGGGGHSRAILEKLTKKGRLLAFDQDEEAIKKNPIKDKRLKIFHKNFRSIKDVLNLKKINNVSGILIDLGVSWHQIDSAYRGFSTRFNSPLDMRMNLRSKYSAKEILKYYSEKKLSEVFHKYGEFKNSKFLAKIIVKKRAKKNIETSFDLMELFKEIEFDAVAPKFFARLFQALRIEVNDEINALKELLTQSSSFLSKEGRISVISYHSLEDRLVKRFFKTGSFEGEKDFLGKKKIIICN
jgi:16S rRNA (cytosine1402-N4)-methyltransferase